MSSGIVDQITLECLMNKDLYGKLVANKKNAQDKKTDNKLYRKRIIALTKDLLANELQTDLMRDVEYAFNNYVKTCIRHFKITDECDVIQQSRLHDDVANSEVNDVIKNENKEESKEENDLMMAIENTHSSKDALMLKSIKFPSGTLDGFVNYHRS
jgi:hypothetical protein